MKTKQEQNIIWTMFYAYSVDTKTHYKDSYKINVKTKKAGHSDRIASYSREYSEKD